MEVWWRIGDLDLPKAPNVPGLQLPRCLPDSQSVNRSSEPQAAIYQAKNLFQGIFRINYLLQWRNTSNISTSLWLLGLLCWKVYAPLLMEAFSPLRFGMILISYLTWDGGGVGLWGLASFIILQFIPDVTLIRHTVHIWRGGTPNWVAARCPTRGSNMFAFVWLIYRILDHSLKLHSWNILAFKVTVLLELYWWCHFFLQKGWNHEYSCRWKCLGNITDATDGGLGAYNTPRQTNSFTPEGNVEFPLCLTFGVRSRRKLHIERPQSDFNPRPSCRETMANKYTSTIYFTQESPHSAFIVTENSIFGGIWKSLIHKVIFFLMYFG